MVIHKAYKYRIYPNKSQKVLIAKTFGCVRFVYNYFLDMRILEWQMEQNSITYHQCSEELTRLKKDEDHLWLREVDSVALQTALKYLDEAYTSFFRGGGFPKFKSKKCHRDSYTTKNNNGSISVLTKAVKLPKLGIIKTKVSRPCDGKILSATISRTSTEKYYISIVCEENVLPLPKNNKSVGFDLGVKSLLILSDGVEIPNPKYLIRAEKQLKAEQRLLSRKTKGSRRYEKQRLVVSKLHEKVTNMRTDYLHKITTWMIQNYGVLCMEDLDVKAMMKDKKLSKFIADTSLGSLRRMLEYKASWYGRTLITVNRYFPSSQLCHQCGYKNPEVKDLSVRKWECPECHTVHDRDHNSSINILNEGLRLLSAA